MQTVHSCAPTVLVFKYIGYACGSAVSSFKGSEEKSATQNPPFLRSAPHCRSEVKGTSSLTGSSEDGKTRRTFLRTTWQSSTVQRDGGWLRYMRILRGLTLMVPHVGQTETVLLGDT